MPKAKHSVKYNFNVQYDIQLQNISVLFYVLSQRGDIRQQQQHTVSKHEDQKHLRGFLTSSSFLFVFVCAVFCFVFVCAVFCFVFVCAVFCLFLCVLFFVCFCVCCFLFVFVCAVFCFVFVCAVFCLFLCVLFFVLFLCVLFFVLFFGTQRPEGVPDYTYIKLRLRLLHT